MEGVCPNGFDAVFGRVNALLAQAPDGVGADKVADGSEPDFSQGIVIDSEVDAVVGATEPVEAVLVLDEERVAVNLGDDIADEVLRTGKLDMRAIAFNQPDVHVVMYADGVEAAYVATFADGLAIGQLVARGGHQANEDKQENDVTSFHGGAGSICVGYGIRHQR